MSEKKRKVFSGDFKAPNRPHDMPSDTAFSDLIRYAPFDSAQGASGVEGLVLNER